VKKVLSSADRKASISRFGIWLTGTKRRRSRAYSASSEPSAAWMRVITGGS
jgi:hypothetical protein